GWMADSSEVERLLSVGIPRKREDQPSHPFVSLEFRGLPRCPFSECDLPTTFHSVAHSRFVPGNQRRIETICLSPHSEILRRSLESFGRPWLRLCRPRRPCSCGPLCKAHRFQVEDTLRLHRISVQGSALWFRRNKKAWYKTGKCRRKFEYH